MSPQAAHARPMSAIPDDEHSAIVHLFRRSSIEMSVHDLPKLPECRALLPGGLQLYISHLPAQGWQQTIDVAAQVRAHGFEPVPHLPVRKLASEEELRQVLEGLSGAGCSEAGAAHRWRCEGAARAFHGDHRSHEHRAAATLWHQLAEHCGPSRGSPRRGRKRSACCRRPPRRNSRSSWASRSPLSPSSCLKVRRSSIGVSSCASRGVPGNDHDRTCGTGKADDAAELRYALRRRSLDSRDRYSWQCADAS